MCGVYNPHIYKKKTLEQSINFFFIDDAINSKDRYNFFCHLHVLRIVGLLNLLGILNSMRIIFVYII